MIQSKTQGLEVKFGIKFQQHFKNFPKADKVLITNFVYHLQKSGFDGLKGRNKSSDDVPKDHPNWLTAVKHAQTHKLWHYHIGIPCYVQSDKGDFTSEYLIHYIRENDFIVIVDMSPHPPFELPSGDYLTY